MMRELPESGSDDHFTPSVVRLAQEGMTFISGDAAVPKSEPSRYATMVGRTLMKVDELGNRDRPNVICISGRRSASGQM